MGNRSLSLPFIFSLVGTSSRPVTWALVSALVGPSPNRHCWPVASSRPAASPIQQTSKSFPTTLSSLEAGLPQTSCEAEHFQRRLGADFHTYQLHTSASGCRTELNRDVRMLRLTSTWNLGHLSVKIKVLSRVQISRWCLKCKSIWCWTQFSSRCGQALVILNPTGCLNTISDFSFSSNCVSWLLEKNGLLSATKDFSYAASTFIVKSLTIYYGQRASPCPPEFLPKSQPPSQPSETEPREGVEQG